MTSRVTVPIRPLGEVPETGIENLNLLMLLAGYDLPGINGILKVRSIIYFRRI